MKTHLNPTESLTVVIDGAEINVTAQQLLGMKQAETTDPDEKYRELLRYLHPQWYIPTDGSISKSDNEIDYQNVPTQLSAQRVRTYIKMLNIAAKLNGEADWEGEGEFLYSCEGKIRVGKWDKGYFAAEIKFKKGLALEALTYLNSEDKIAMFGCDKVKQD
jgi:hypothetical protein